MFMRSNDDDLDLALELMKNPNRFNRIMQHALAHMQLSIHTERAHEHCKKHNIGLLGDNVWIAILEDSIKQYKDR
jgi:hypothetical protein